MNIHKLLPLITLIVIGCSPDEGSTSLVTNTDSLISGTIILPNNDMEELNKMEILSSVERADIKDNNFLINTSGKFTLLLLNNSGGDPIMLGYNYPGAKTNDITAESTILGLIMMTPAALNLSDNGKIELINEVVKNENYKILLDLVNEKIILRENLFDSNNQQFIDALKSLFNSIAVNSRTNRTYEELPIYMAKSGKNFVFNNGGNAFSTVVGLYKENQLIKKFTIDGVKVVPTSLYQIYSGTGGANEYPKEIHYKVDGVGSYNFKLRTGKPGYNDGSLEHKEAFYANIEIFLSNFIFTVLPSLESDCLQNIIMNVINYFRDLSEISANSDMETSEILFFVSKTTVENLSNLSVSCATGKINKNFFRSFAKMFNFFEIAFGTISNGANTTIHATQWKLNKPIVDLCYDVNETSAEKCEVGWYRGSYSYSIFDSDGYNCRQYENIVGDVYFYITSLKKVTFMRSIVPGMDDLWDSTPNGEGPYPGYHYNAYYNLETDWLPYSRIVFGKNSWYEIYIGILQVLTREKIRRIPSHECGSCEYNAWSLPDDDPEICLWNRYKFFYKVNYTEATYVGEDPPSDLTNEEITKMINLKEKARRDVRLN